MQLAASSTTHPPNSRARARARPSISSSSGSGSGSVSSSNCNSYFRRNDIRFDSLIAAAPTQSVGFRNGIGRQSVATFGHHPRRCRVRFIILFCISPLGQASGAYFSFCAVAPLQFMYFWHLQFQLLAVATTATTISSLLSSCRFRDICLYQMHILVYTICPGANTWSRPGSYLNLKLR